MQWYLFKFMCVKIQPFIHTTPPLTTHPSGEVLKQKMQLIPSLFLIKL